MMGRTTEKTRQRIGRQAARWLTEHPEELFTQRELARMLRVSTTTMGDAVAWMRDEYDNLGVYPGSGVMMTVDGPPPADGETARSLLPARRLREWLAAHPGEHIYRKEAGKIAGVTLPQLLGVNRLLRRQYPDQFHSQTGATGGVWWTPKDGDEPVATNGHTRNKPRATNGPRSEGQSSNGQRPAPSSSTDVELLFEDDTVMLLLRDGTYQLYRKVATV